ncbi:hypothetical protein LMG26788_02849 [Achromobacter pulmonis]|uniref:Glycosyltransferase n=1 Tax=Achromobacter pulmonis TaxID=1389932 RepID=A0A6S7D9D1_9BURK|nr:hypothetical protein LMG26696_02839 [Achromobacter pulmonis]CAB3872461.1 hypothetical protein LMG26788_02849 [Achromobacter pulmonis]
MSPYRVLHLPTSVGGNPQGLSAALRQEGVASDTLTTEQNYLQYPVDIVVNPEGVGPLGREWRRWQTLWRDVPGYDVLHFNFGTTLARPHAWSASPGSGWLKRLMYPLHAVYLWLLQGIELTRAKRRGVPMFVTYQGDDARQGDYSLAHFPICIARQVGPDYYNAASDAFKRRQIRRLDKYCDRIYSVNPDLLRVLPARAEFVPYSHIFLEEWSPHYTQGEPRSLRIAHAPSNRQVKGTDHILAALESLRKRGFEFELILVEGMSHAQARQQYERADVLVDQLFAGWYGGLAVELMALGKPVLSYIRQEDLSLLPPDMVRDLPVLQITATTVEQALERVMRMPRAELVAWARRSRAYVERWHDPHAIARKIKADYEEALARRRASP